MAVESVVIGGTVSELRNPNPNAVAALEKIMQEMQNLVAHPRIQQKTWVAQAKTWLPLLHIIHGELTGQRVASVPEAESSPSTADEASLLVQYNGSFGSSYVNITLANVQQVGVYRGGQPGYGHVRGGHSYVQLKDGRKFITSADEAQRVVDVMRRHDEANIGTE